MLMPKRVKYRRQHRQSTKGKSKGGNVVDFGEFGLQATTAARVTSRQIEAARIAMTRYMSSFYLTRSCSYNESSLYETWW